MYVRSDDYNYNLGTFERKITTSSAAAQTWFNRGLIWSYAFHHEEAARCFCKAIEEDSSAAMAYWGTAYALGPNYNKPWDMFDPQELIATLNSIKDHIEKAQTHSKTATSVEKALIGAIQSRVPTGSCESDFLAANTAYADAMSAVYSQFPDDLDVVSLYADALMNLTAWDLWDLKTGLPTPGSRAVEAKRVLDAALLSPASTTHPGILHMYIHLMEMSSTPEAALVPADHLRTLCPDAGHLVHMPSHIDILVGDYRQAIASNAAACLGDEKYLAANGGTNFYTFYRLHDYHSLIYAAMFAGQFKVAMDTVKRMEASIPEEFLRIESPPMAHWLENFASVRVHVLVRFGRWDELIALPMPGDKTLYSVTTAMLHYGKGVAYAATGDIRAAEEQREFLQAAVQQVQPERIVGDFPNKANVVLQVAIAMLDGEIEYRKANYEDAFQHLRTAIERDDALNYAEPWPWMQPTRHAYGALLMEQGRVEEAAKTYAEDLGFDDALPRARWHPNNVWALHGYHECLVKLGREQEAGIVRQALVLAEAVADVEIWASCCCRAAGEKTSCC
ncbi:hypothetical protein M011DRAFT_433351 [Sporormia fimetaria CBS 119925]|uniref:Uncharacterized protein n=1 Tax=Sporormia fimetaria CBS 119925 TaxID=1340428 RepID=A0A6A6UVC9_9PLEO|nr:hypothetical protein M011DRAFT_433351 [Sporormia fimetaria CBS 119925]